MEIISKKMNGNQYEFICKYYETSRNWGHKVKLLKNGYCISTSKITYYNRTWENYKFQSCMRKCVDNVYTEKMKTYIAEWKDGNGIKKLKEEERKRLEKEYEKTEGKDLKKLYKLLESKNNFKSKYIDMDF